MRWHLESGDASMRGGGQIIAKMLSDDGLVMPQRTVRLYAIAASGRDAPMSVDDVCLDSIALVCVSTRCPVTSVPIKMTRWVCMNLTRHALARHLVKVCVGI